MNLNIYNSDIYAYIYNFIQVYIVNKKIIIFILFIYLDKKII